MPTASAQVLAPSLPTNSDLATRQRRARLILAAAAVAGPTGDVLLRAGGIGINAPLGLLLVATGVAVLGRRGGSFAAEGREPLAVAVLLALLPAWRDAGPLAAGNIVGALGALVVAAYLAVERPAATLAALRPGQALALLTRLVPHGLFGAFPFLRSEARLAWLGHGRHVLAAQGLARASALAAIVASTFALLLAAGDAVFAAGVGLVLDIDGASVASHAAWTGVVGWVTMGWLARWATPRPSLVRPIREPLASLDTSAVLYGMVAIFLAFLGVQLRVLFGGQAYVHSVTGLTLAEYARSGFFALMAATALVLAVLLFLDSRAGAGGLAASARHRRASLALAGMVSLMLVSAVVRMRLYVDAFGLSRDRLVAVAGMAGAAALLVTFAATVLRGRRARFVPAAFRLSWVGLVALNVLSPDAVVARVNIARARRGAPLDASYHATLSADAVPLVLTELRRELATDPAAPGWCGAARDLLATYGTAASRSFLAWNSAYGTARRAVGAETSTLQRLACPTG